MIVNWTSLHPQNVWAFRLPERFLSVAIRLRWGREGFGRSAGLGRQPGHGCKGSWKVVCCQRKTRLSYAPQRTDSTMAKCNYCGSTILFGGKRQGDLRFCNATCAGRGSLLLISRQVPENIVNEAVLRVHQGLCPKCGGTGPVDVHVHHRVWSALVLTSWKSAPQISCRSCGVKSQMGDSVFSLVLG